MTGKILPLDKYGDFWKQTVNCGCGYRIFDFQDETLTDAEGLKHSFTNVENGMGGYTFALEDVRAERERFLAQRGPLTHFYDLEKGRTVFAQEQGPMTEQEEREAAALYRALDVAREALLFYANADGKRAKRVLDEIYEIMKGAVTPLPSAESADREAAGGVSPMNSSVEGASQQVGEEDMGKWEDEIRGQRFRHPWAARTKCLITDLRQARERIDSLEQELRKDRAATESIIERQQKELAKQAQKTERLKRLIKQATQEGDKS